MIPEIKFTCYVKFDVPYIGAPKNLRGSQGTDTTRAANGGDKGVRLVAFTL